MCQTQVLPVFLLVAANIEGLVTRGKVTRDKARKALSMLKGVSDYSEFKEMDMVIEVGYFVISTSKSWVAFVSLLIWYIRRYSEVGQTEFSYIVPALHFPMHIWSGI